MAKESKLTIPMNLDISRESYAKLAAARNTTGNETMTAFALGAMCGQLIESYANGGLMIRAENVKHLEDATATSIATETALVAAVQKKNSREMGKNTVPVNFDDAVFPAIEEHARTVGMTTQEVLDDMAHRMVRDSLAFYISNQNYEPVVYLTEAQGRKLEKIIGKRHINGDDILALVEKELVGA
jgi:hypothetical protein